MAGMGGAPIDIEWGGVTPYQMHDCSSTADNLRQLCCPILSIINQVQLKLSLSKSKFGQVFGSIYVALHGTATIKSQKRHIYKLRE